MPTPTCDAAAPPSTLSLLHFKGHTLQRADRGRDRSIDRSPLLWPGGRIFSAEARNVGLLPNPEGKERLRGGTMHEGKRLRWATRGWSPCLSPSAPKKAKHDPNGRQPQTPLGPQPSQSGAASTEGRAPKKRKSRREVKGGGRISREGGSREAGLPNKPPLALP